MLSCVPRPSATRDLIGVSHALCISALSHRRIRAHPARGRVHRLPAPRASLRTTGRLRRRQPGACAISAFIRHLAAPVSSTGVRTRSLVPTALTTRTPAFAHPSRILLPRHSLRASTDSCPRRPRPRTACTWCQRAAHVLGAMSVRTP